MAETLSSNDGDEALKMETLRSRLNQLMESVAMECENEDRSCDFDSFLEDGVAELLRARSEIDLEDEAIASLGKEDSETLLDELKKELSLVEEEGRKTEDKVADLIRVIHEDSAKVWGDLAVLDYLYKSKYSEDTGEFQDATSDCKSAVEGHQESAFSESKNDSFKAFQLIHQIEMAENHLNQLLDLDSIFKRNEAYGQILEVVSEDVKPINFEGNHIRLSIRTPIFSSDVSLLGQKLDCIIEPLVVYHELVVEVEETMELKNIEIFPNDVCLDSVVSAAKLSSQPFCLHMEPPIKSPLEWLVRKVKQQIFICNVRRVVVKDANKSRHSFEYSDKDETVVAHLVGGIDAYFKICLGWPISPAGLQLISVKCVDNHAKGLPLSSLYKIKEKANSLDAQVRHHLPHFADAIEEILLEVLHQES